MVVKNLFMDLYVLSLFCTLNLVVTVKLYLVCYSLQFIFCLHPVLGFEALQIHWAPVLWVCGRLSAHRVRGVTPYMPAYMPPECLIGMVTPESVIFSFGIVLLDLLRGKQISKDDSLDMIMRKEIHTSMDSRLNSEYSLKAATALKELASQCLLNNPKDRPTIKDANAALAQVQSNTRISFPMAEAVTRMDLTAIHQILVLAHYKGDEASRELSFQDWQHMREMLEARNRGDLAFNDKDLKTAIECYSQLLDKGKLVSATVHVRRSLCYLMSAQPDKALHDAMQAQCIQANLPMALYMHAVALCLLNMNRESSYMLNEAVALEKQRPRNSRQGA